MDPDVILDKTGFPEAFHIAVDDFGIIRDDGAVVMIIADSFVEVIAHAGVKDRVDLPVKKLFDMPMRDFRRVAGGIRRDRMLSLEIDIAVRGRRDDDAEAERREKRMPERQELIKIQDEREPDRFAPQSRFVAIFAQERFLILEQVVFRPGGGDRNRPVALVPADKAPVAVERVDRQPAMIGAFIADGGADGMREIRESVAVYQPRTRLAFVLGEPLRVERGAERAHQSGDSRTNDFASDFLLKGAEDGVVQERPARDCTCAV